MFSFLLTLLFTLDIPVDLMAHCEKFRIKKQGIEMVAETTVHCIVVSFDKAMRLQLSKRHFHTSMKFLQHIMLFWRKFDLDVYRTT